MVARLTFKVNEGIVPPGVECAVQFDPTRENLPGPDIVRIDRFQLFLDSMGGGAWPLAVRGFVVCLVYSDNERDLNLDIYN